MWKDYIFVRNTVCAVFPSCMCVMQLCFKLYELGRYCLTYALDVFNLCKKMSLITGFSSHLLIYICFLKIDFQN